MSFKADSAMAVACQKALGALDAESFNSDLLTQIIEATSLLQYPTYFPKLFKGVIQLTEILPQWALEKWFNNILIQKRCQQVSLNRGSRSKNAIVVIVYYTIGVER